MHRIILCLMLPFTIQASEYYRLAKDLLKNYVKEVRPSCSGQPVVVYIDVALRQIGGLNDRNQILDTIVWMRYGWYDCNLSWNTSQYGGIENISIPETKVWLPDIILYENTVHEQRGIQKNNHLLINSTGFIQYNFPSQPSTSCNLDIRNFPFDVQICKLTFGSWSYDDFGLKVVNKRDIGDISNYLKNGEWKLIHFTVSRNTKRYECCKGPFSTVVFEISIQRKSAIHLLNVIFPSILVTTISLLAFFIPAGSGEKVSITVTVLLSLAVFHLVISETLPPNSDSLPYLGYFFLANMLFVGICCTMSIIVLNIYHSKTDNTIFFRIIRCLRTKRALMKIGKKLNYDVTMVPSKSMTAAGSQLNQDCVQTNQRQEQRRRQKSDLSVNNEILLNAFLNEMGKYLAEKKENKTLKDESAIVERLVERCFLIVALILYISVVAIIFNLH